MVGRNCEVMQENACLRSSGAAEAHKKWGRDCDANKATSDESGKECR